MTAITPLESIHKKGIFGDHQKKDENELLQISEEKAIKWKMSKILYNRLNKNFTRNEISATNQNII